MLCTQAGRTVWVRALAVMTTAVAMSALVAIGISAAATASSAASATLEATPTAAATASSSAPPTAAAGASWAMPVGAVEDARAGVQTETIWLSDWNAGQGEPAPGAVAPRLTVLEETADGLLISLELPAIQVEPVQMDGVTYQALGIEGGNARGELGEPMLPTFSRFVQIPARSGVQIQVVATSTVEPCRVT